MKSRWKVDEKRMKSRWKQMKSRWKRRWKSNKKIDEKVYMKRYIWKEGKEDDKELNVRKNDSTVFEIKSRHSSRH